jgi:hypothetical protein
MYKSNFSISFIPMLFILASCNNQKQEKMAEKPKYKPEEVITIWQKSVDNNDYTEAKELSTDNALEYINSMQEASDMDSVQVFNSSFVEMKNNTISDTEIIFNTTLLYEDGIKTNDKFVLVKRLGNWLIKDVNPKEDLKESSTIQ